MTSEIYLCHKCKEQREYLYDNNGIICSYKPCNCESNSSKPILRHDRTIKALDQAIKNLETYAKKLKQQLEK